MEDGDYSIFSSTQMVNSARYSVYKNPAYALAELCDNSVDAGAKHVELLCLDSWSQDSSRTNVTTIAVLDDGCGMDKNDLRVSLRFGDGKGFIKGSGRLGRFGYGLPNASISQCAKVEVYSWKDGADNALYTYLDVGEMKSGKMTDVPEPTPKLIPDLWKNASKYISKQGTLVVWSKLDKCTWKTSKTLIEHSKLLLGRIYRKYIENDSLLIRMAAFKEYENTPNLEITKVRPNDPLYLTQRSSTPEPWDKEAMFRKWGDSDKKPININYKGKNYQVFTRYSIVKNEARPDDQAGALPHGKHALENTGVSLIRENREIDLDTSLTISETRERWWGAEIIFSDDLDDFFGITNDKQHANVFSDVAKNISRIISGSKSQQSIIDEMANEGDDLRASMARLIVEVQREIGHMRDQIKISKKETRKKRHGEKETKAARERRKKGNKGRSDKTEEEKLEPKIWAAMQKYMKNGFSEEEAKRKAFDEVLYSNKFVWNEGKLTGSNFFEVSNDDGKIRIDLNTNHAAYKNLYAVIRDIPDDMSLDDAKDLLNRTYTGMRLLLASWARFEDETTDDDRLVTLQDTRTDWGRVLRDFLKYNT